MEQEQVADQPVEKKKGRQKKPPPEPLDLVAKGLQTFKVEKVHRSKLLGAPYNPRMIGDSEKRKLRAGLKRHGLVEPIVWNKRTSHICGGHQRIGQLDSLAGTSDYTLDVAVIDVDETREKEINVLLNNAETQGDWDLDKLGLLVKDSVLNLEGMGFDTADVFKIFGDTVLMREDPLDQFAQKVREARDAYRGIAAKTAAKEQQHNYIVVVFRDDMQASKFLRDAGIEDNRYVSGEDLIRLLDKVLAKEPQGT
jgi:hypothetical protein